MLHLTAQIWAVLAVSAAFFIIGGTALTFYKHRERTQRLRLLFGSEYDEAIQLYGDKDRAEQALLKREKRLEDLGVHQLTENERMRFADEWNAISSIISRDSVSAVIRSDQLATAIMRAEGCPAHDFDERAEDFSLVHPDLARNYRQASDIVGLQHAGVATPEDRRMALALYAGIFEDILGPFGLPQERRRAS